MKKVNLMFKSAYVGMKEKVGIKKDTVTSEQLAHATAVFSETNRQFEDIARINRSYVRREREVCAGNGNSYDAMADLWTRTAKTASASNDSIQESSVAAAKAVKDMQIAHQDLVVGIQNGYIDPLNQFQITRIVPIQTNLNSERIARIEYEQNLQTVKEIKEGKTMNFHSVTGLTLEQAQAALDESNKTFEAMERDLVRDIAVCEHDKEVALCRAYAEYIKNLQQYHEKCSKLLLEVIPTLDTALGQANAKSAVIPEVQRKILSEESSSSSNNNNTSSNNNNSGNDNSDGISSVTKKLFSTSLFSSSSSSANSNSNTTTTTNATSAPSTTTTTSSSPVATTTTGTTTGTTAAPVNPSIAAIASENSSNSNGSSNSSIAVSVKAASQFNSAAYNSVSLAAGLSAVSSAYVALYDFQGTETGHMNLTAGVKLFNVSPVSENPEWSSGYLEDGKYGIFPSSYVSAEKL